MKLHLCCGDIYLIGYENVDVQGKMQEGELPEQATTLENYFKYPMGTPRREIIVDRRLNLTESWACYNNNSIDEIVMISCIEHFTKKQAEHIISEVKRVLKPTGVFKVDFPDIVEDIVHYYWTNPDYCMELIYCNQKDEFSCHHWGYNEKSFKQLLGEGWESIDFGKNSVVKHDYPMIGCTSIKK